MSEETVAPEADPREGRTAADLPEQTASSVPADVAKIEDIEEAMRDVVDPELGINVVDLGLVYDIRVEKDNSATLDMTLTSAACPLTDVIEDQTSAALTSGGLVERLPDQLGLDAAVGPGKDHRRRPRAAACARVHRLSFFEGTGHSARSGVACSALRVV